MMKIVYILLALLLISLTVLQNMLWLTAVFVVVFTYFFGAIWLFALAVLIDGYFGAFQNWPLFSTLAVLWYVVSELVRLRMRIIE